MCFIAQIGKSLPILNSLQPTGNFTYHTRFNIKKFHIEITRNLWVLYESRNKQQILPYRTLKDWFL